MNFVRTCLSERRQRVIFGSVEPSSAFPERTPVFRSRLAAAVLAALLSAAAIAAPPGITELQLERLNPTAKVTDTVATTPGSFKAFEADPNDSWLLIPQEGSSDNALVNDVAAGGSVVFGVDVAAARFGRFKVPDGKTAYIVAANPSASGKWLLVRQQVQDDPVKAKPAK